MPTWRAPSRMRRRPSQRRSGRAPTRRATSRSEVSGVVDPDVGVHDLSVEELVDLVGGDRATDPGVELFEVGAPSDPVPDLVGEVDATGVQDCEKRLGFALGLAFDLAFAEVAAAPVSDGAV